MAFVLSTSNGATSATPSVPVPAGAQANDIAIIVLTMDNSGANVDPGDQPTDFVELVEHDLSFDGQMAWVGWKRLTGGDSGSYTFGNVGVSSAYLAHCLLFRGRHTTDPPVISATATNNAGSTSPVTITANGLTLVEGDDLVLISCPDVNETGTGNGHTFTGYTTAQDTENGFQNIGTAYKENNAAGPTGSIAWTFSMTGGVSPDAGWDAWTLRIPAAPAAAGGGKRRPGIRVGGRMGNGTLLAA